MLWSKLFSCEAALSFLCGAHLFFFLEPADWPHLNKVIHPVQIIERLIKKAQSLHMPGHPSDMPANKILYFDTFINLITSYLCKDPKFSSEGFSGFLSSAYSVLPSDLHRANPSCSTRRLPGETLSDCGNSILVPPRHPAPFHYSVLISSECLGLLGMIL